MSIIGNGIFIGGGSAIPDGDNLAYGGSSVVGIAEAGSAIVGGATVGTAIVGTAEI